MEIGREGLREGRGWRAGGTEGRTGMESGREGLRDGRGGRSGGRD